MKKVLNFNCPVCGSEMRRESTDSPYDEETFHMVCTNINCGISKNVDANNDDDYKYIAELISVKRVG